MSLLRHTELVPADKAFYEAGLACRVSPKTRTELHLKTETEKTLIRVLRIQFVACVLNLETTLIATPEKLWNQSVIISKTIS